MDLSIQIINYNTKKYLVDCLDGLFKDLKDSAIQYEVLVLDNDSADNLSDLETNYSEVKFFKSKKNGGFSWGHNFLSGYGSGKYILILNPDIKFIEPSTISRLFLKLKDGKSREICAIGPKLLNSKMLPQEYDHGELRGIRAWIAKSGGGTFWRNRNIASYVAWVSGACFIIKRDVFEKAGRFDENFFLYKEEEDLFLRLRDDGYKIFYFPSVKLMHYGSVVASKDKFLKASKEYFLKKHPK